MTHMEFIRKDYCGSTPNTSQSSSLLPLWPPWFIPPACLLWKTSVTSHWSFFGPHSPPTHDQAATVSFLIFFFKFWLWLRTYNRKIISLITFKYLVLLYTHEYIQVQVYIHIVVQAVSRMSWSCEMPGSSTHEKQLLVFCSLQPLTSTILLSVSMNLTIPDTS